MAVNKKYAMIAEKDSKLYHIVALRHIDNYNFEDTMGGYIEKVDNLNTEDNAWITRNAKVYDDAKVYDNARVSDNVQIYDDAQAFGSTTIYNDANIFGNAKVYGNAHVYGNAQIFADACIFGDAEVFGDAHIGKYGYIEHTTDYLFIGPIGSRDDCTTFYKTKDKGIYVSCGCFNDSLDAFEKKVRERHGKDKYGDQYLDTIEYIKKLYK